MDCGTYRGTKYNPVSRNRNYSRGNIPRSHSLVYRCIQPDSLAPRASQLSITRANVSGERESRKGMPLDRQGHSESQSRVLPFSATLKDLRARYVRLAPPGREVKPSVIDVERRGAARETTRNARRDGSRPSAERDTRRVAPAGAAPHWLALPPPRGLAPGSGQPTRRQPRRSAETACAPTQGGSWLEARGSHSVNQSLSRPAARHEVGSTSVVDGACGRGIRYLHARVDRTRRGSCSSSRPVRNTLPSAAHLCFLASSASTSALDARYRHGWICESERAYTVSCTVASRGTSR